MLATRRLSALLFAASLALALPFTSLAEPAGQSEGTTATESAPGSSTAPASDDEGYAGREASSGPAADFKGGDAIVITSTALIIVLLVVLVLVLI